MICENCGKERGSGRFCRWCGAEVRERPDEEVKDSLEDSCSGEEHEEESDEQDNGDTQRGPNHPTMVDGIHHALLILI